MAKAFTVDTTNQFAAFMEADDNEEEIVIGQAVSKVQKVEVAAPAPVAGNGKVVRNQRTQANVEAGAEDKPVRRPRRQGDQDRETVAHRRNKEVRMDRHSGTGRGKEQRKGGAGGFGADGEAANDVLGAAEDVAKEHVQEEAPTPYTPSVAEPVQLTIDDVKVAPALAPKEPTTGNKVNTLKGTIKTRDQGPVITKKQESKEETEVANSGFQFRYAPQRQRRFDNREPREQREQVEEEKPVQKVISVDIDNKAEFPSL